MGACLTVLLVFVTLSYSYTKLLTLKRKRDVNIMSALMEYSLPYDEPFTGHKDGFFVAAALTEYDSIREIIEDREYGELFFEWYGWGYGDSIGSKSTELEYHYCSEQELGLQESTDSLIYPVQESYKRHVELYK